VKTQYRNGLRLAALTWASNEFDKPREARGVAQCLSAIMTRSKEAWMEEYPPQFCCAVAQSSAVNTRSVLPRVVSRSRNGTSLNSGFPTPAWV
jgi:hypothetical protein